MKLALLCLVLVVPILEHLRAATAVSGAVASSSEFVGPFASWENARSRFGAAGDGVADDSTALQTALDALAAGRKFAVLFLPAGTYRITRTLSLTSALDVRIVGANPETTTIAWEGDPGGTMLMLNGVAYSSLARLTFDGRRRARTAVDQSWDGERPTFDTGNEYVDDRFVDVDYGIRGGFRGHGFAETTVLRVQFVRDRSAGISLGNFNALDLWVWNSLFEDCGAGVTNAEGAGNFHVYSSVFRRSRQADLAMGNTGGFSARGNFSRGSRAFFVSTVSKAYPAVIHLQRNVVVDPTSGPPIDLLNQGPGLLTDNIFVLPPATAGAAVRWSAPDGADVTSIGNTFSVVRPFETNGRLIAIGDRKGGADAARPPEPGLEPPPAPTRQQIVDVRQGSTARDIQNAIDKAAATGAIVHVPVGEYAIDRTLTIPSHGWIVGDGARTLLHWTGTTSGPVLLVNGRSAATVSDIKIDAAGKADGLALTGVDAEDGVVRLDRVQLRAAVRADLLINQLDDTVVDARDFGHAYSPGGAAVKAIGGPRLAAGQPAHAALNVFSGAASGNGISYDVSRGARVLVRDLWYESGAAPGFATVHDRAVLTLDGSRIASAANGTPAAVAVAAPDGRVAILASHLDDRVAIIGDARRLRVLALSSFDEQETPSLVVSAASSPGIFTVANTRRKAAGRRGNASIAAPDVGTADPSVVEDLVGHARSAWPDFSTARPAGVTDVRLVRVWIEHGLTNLTIAR